MIRLYFHPTPNPAKVALFLEESGQFMASPSEHGELPSWLFFIASGIGPYSGQAVHFQRSAPEKLPCAINRFRREAMGKGLHALPVYPAATDTPMLAPSEAGPELGFDKEPASAVVDVVVAGIEAGALEVVCGGGARTRMATLNRDDPAGLDACFLALKPALEAAVRNHSAL